MNKQKKIILISIIAASIILISAIICVTISLLKDRNSHNKKDDITQKETTEFVENISTNEEITTEESTTEEPTTEEPTTEELTTEEITTEVPTTQAPTQAPTEPPTEAPTVPAPVEEPMTFSVVDGVLYQSNSKKSEIVETGLAYYYKLSSNNKAIFYRNEDSGKTYIRVVGQDKVEINIENGYGGSLLNIYDTGEAYILGEPIMTTDIYSCRTIIYYFDGKEFKIVTDRAPAGQMSATPTTKVAERVPIIMFEQFESIGSDKIDYFVIACKDEIQEVEVLEDVRIWSGTITIQEYGKKIWYTKYENDIRSVYEIANISGKFGNPKLFDTNLESVCVDYINGFNQTIISFGEEVVYYKNKNRIYTPNFSDPYSISVVVDSVDMYISGKLIDKNVYAQSVWEKNDALYYYTDYDVNQWAGVLKKYSDGKIETVAVGVKSFNFPEDGKLEITYLNGDVTTMSY